MTQGYEELCRNSLLIALMNFFQCEANELVMQGIVGPSAFHDSLYHTQFMMEYAVKYLNVKNFSSEIPPTTFQVITCT